MPLHLMLYSCEKKTSGLFKTAEVTHIFGLLRNVNIFSVLCSIHCKKDVFIVLSQYEIYTSVRF